MPTIPRLFGFSFSIIDRYLLREFLLSMSAVLGILWLIFIATRFARYLAEASVGTLPSEVIFTLLGYSSLGALTVLLPMACFLAVMLALGRMNSDLELTAMSACGIPQKRLVKNIILFSGTVAIVVAILSLSVVPAIKTDSYSLQQRSKLAADTSGLIAGKFKESRDGTWTFFSQGLSEDKQNMENVFIEIHDSERPMIFRSEKGRFEIDDRDGSKYLVLEDGYRYQGAAGDQDFVIVRFEKHALLVKKGEGNQIRERQQSLPSSVLWQRGQNRDLAELQWRVSLAVMTIILCLLAIKLADTGPRKGRYAGFFPAVLAYIIYSNLLGVTRAWVAKGEMVPWMGALWVHVLMLILLIMMLNQHRIRNALSKLFDGGA